MNKRILIIENNIEVIELLIYSLVAEKVSDKDNVFPKIVNPWEDEPNSGNNEYQNLIGYYNNYLYTNDPREKEKIFEKIFNIHTSIDYYIIDKELVSRRNDNIGIDFYKFLTAKKQIDKNHIFFISTFNPNDFGVQIDINNFFDKQTKGYTTLIAQRIKKLK